MKILIYCFLWLFAVTNAIAAMIYTGYYFLFIPQFNAAFSGWFLVISSLIDMPLIVRSTHRIGAKHAKWLLTYLLLKIFCILLTIKFSIMVHPAGKTVTVTEVLTVFFLVIHSISLIVIYFVRNYKPRSIRRTFTASLFYLIAISLTVSSMGLIGSDIYTRIQTEYYGKKVEKLLPANKSSVSTKDWKQYKHIRKPEDILPGFQISVPQGWTIDDHTITISTHSAKLHFDRSSKNSKLCIYSDTSRSDILYNNHVYISLLPVYTFDLNGQKNRIGLLPVERHSSALSFLVCERWVRFDGLVEYTSEIYNQDIGNAYISVNRNDIQSLKQIVTMLQTLTILP